MFDMSFLCDPMRSGSLPGPYRGRASRRSRPHFQINRRRAARSFSGCEPRGAEARHWGRYDVGVGR
jgi:hypothetical protein